MVRVRVLIVGAGIAGLTCAALLERQGRAAVVVDRAESTDDGYALGLYPMGSSVLHGLGAYSRLVGRSVPADRYLATSASGRVLQSLDMSVLTGAVGPMLMVARRDLIEVLAECLERTDLRRGVTVGALEQTPDSVRVSFSNGTTESFDVVIGCDGMSSSTRRLVFGPATGFESGWALWTWWARSGLFDPTVVREWWGAGWFFGAYPAPGRVMCAAGGPTGKHDGDKTAPAALPPELARRLEQGDPAVTAATQDTNDVYRWPMSDVLAHQWVSGRVALCGDAAAGFLPTAGVGATSAMRSAAGLADELSRADAQTVPLALARYEKRCRRVVEAQQNESRWLARVMFVRSPQMSKVRDRIAARYPARWALRRVIDSAREPF